MGEGTRELLPAVPAETRGEGRPRKWREWKKGAVSEGRRLNLGRSSRETIGLASCSQFSLLNSFSFCTWGLLSRNGSSQWNLLPSPALARGCKAKFPGWQISNFFTRLQTLGAGVGWGGGLCGPQGGYPLASNNRKDFGG